ncbi:hypothetical protein ACAW74_02610 [Fibrella sp. WM1]|uniref:hypothetical protein n=1 Tax=Fibrella musci TaxID=3242485 RepID=UPI003521BCE6
MDAWHSRDERVIGYVAGACRGRFGMAFTEAISEAFTEAFTLINSLPAAVFAIFGPD